MSTAETLSQGLDNGQMCEIVQIPVLQFLSSKMALQYWAQFQSKIISYQTPTVYISWCMRLSVFATIVLLVFIITTTTCFGLRPSSSGTYIEYTL
jgi:hypothetical protein